MRALFLESLPYRSAFRVGSHHYAERFAGAGWETMWLSQPISALHALHPVKRDWDERVEGWRRGPVMRDGVSYYSPFTLLPSVARPVLGSPWVARHSSLATLPSTRGVVSRAGFSAADVAWLTNPIYEPLVRSLSPRCVAVRVADEHAAFRNVAPAVAELERRAIEAADVVFAVAGSVHARLAERHPNVVLLPNGVEFERFSAPRPEPGDIAALPHPRVLYVGAVEYWFDGELLAQAAAAHPHASFVVIGPPAEGLTAAERLPNVHVLGSRAYEQVPAYMQHCDLGIVPFRRDALVDAIHPIKVYEYLAAGLPVLATRWTELDAMGAPVSLCEPAEFVARLGELLEAPDLAGDLAARQAYARGNSWDARFEVALAEVRRVLERSAA